MRKQTLVSTREAAELLGQPRCYFILHWYAKSGRIKPVVYSPRKWFWPRDQVEKIAKERAQFGV